MRLRYALLSAALGLAPAARGQAAQDLTLVAPDGQPVAIDRDDYGAPHISAPTEAAVFFGQGFAAAQDRLFQMETFWRTATGRTAEINPAPAAFSTDQQVRTVFYTPAERQAQFGALPAPVRAMMTAYVAGVNTYIDSVAANPARYRPYEYTQPPLNAAPPERWTVDKLVAVVQFFMRRFGEIGGQELTRLAELQANGPAWFNENRPVNEPTAYPTIRPSGPVAAPVPPAYRGPDVDPAMARQLEDQRASMLAFLDGLGVPRRFGSFAAAVSPARSDSGRAMLLGAPQMGLPQQNQKAVVSEVELLVGPATNPELHVAGMTVPGIPGVIIGRAKDRTWTLTTGFTDNVDTYVELLDPTRQRYRYHGAFVPFEVLPQTIRRLGRADTTVLALRTVHGPVVGLDAARGQAFAYRYAFWNRELEMVAAFYDAWKAPSLAAFASVASRVTMSFNLFYADRPGNIAFWHVGVYPQRPGTVDPRLPALGDGSEEWVGLVPFATHPQETNPAQGYFVNWNNKPAAWWNQGDNVPWRRDNGRYYDGARFLAESLEGAGPVSFDDLKELFRVVRTNPRSPEYPGTYQQVLAFGPVATRAENVIPPGQSGFINTAGQPSPNFADQWALYVSSVGAGPIRLKPFLFHGDVAVAAEGGPDAGAFALDGARPNPARNAVALRYRLGAAADVRLALFDVLGREVALVEAGPQAAGVHAARADLGALAPGVYVVRLQSGDRTLTHRLVVAR